MDNMLILLKDKKLLIKVVAGILLLAIAFFFYLGKEDGSAEIKVEEPSINALEEVPEETSAEPPPTAMIVVDVAGSVMTPAVVTLPEGSRVYEAIDLAGGLKGEADTTNISLAQTLSDGEKLYIPSKQEIKEGFVSTGANVQMAASGNKQDARININTADSVTLQQLNGVGPSMAEKIIRYRNEQGKFNKIEDLKNVSGIGEKTFEKLKEKITV